ncbi:MAG: phosphoglucosamine mutase [Vicinamibacterales bacterium]
MRVKLFGTDGIRGKAGVPPLDRDTVARVGAALIIARADSGTRDAVRVLVGRDTRESGPWIEQELARGVTSRGARVTSAGIIPTPAVAYLTRSEGFDLGVVLSASHNPFEDNGIKVFSGAGEKLTGALESHVEAVVADRSWHVADDGASKIEARDFRGQYNAHLRQVLTGAGALAGSRIVVDCANGATAAVAPAFFADLGFEVVAIGIDPDGRNINAGCGSTHLDVLQRRVRHEQARLGVAFDGDGDRALFVDARGERVDGDAVLLMTAEHLQRHHRLPGAAIVATVMSNIGLELALRDRGIGLVRTAVGDKYVMEEMLARGLALGGEQSGHIILAHHLFTGDGMATALQVLAVMADTNRELADLASALVTYPQVLVNVRVRQKTDLSAVPVIADAMRRVESHLAGEGRLLVRYSGTEPLLRIMLEGKDQDEIQAWADEIASVVRAELGQ